MSHAGNLRARPAYNGDASPDEDIRSLRIGVNASYLIPGRVGGTEIYLRSLLAGLAEIDSRNQYVVFTNRETGTDLVPARPNFKCVPVSIRASFRPARILWEQIGLPLAVARRHLDILLNPGFTSPIVCPCATVTVFHDLQHKRRPELFRRFDLPFWRILLYASAHLSTHLLAISAATRDDLLRFYRIAPEKITVTLLGVDPLFFGITRRRQPADPYVLTVSTLHPHKNVDGLMRAFAEFRKTRPEFRLIVVGLRGFSTAALEKLRTALGLSEAVRFTGWIPRGELYDLFAGATAFVYPSTFEGFGLPVLEALAAGIPVACSRIEPLSSLAGSAALQFDPGEPRAILDAMVRITSDIDLRARLSMEGPVRAKEFSWEKTARLTLEAITASARQSAPSR
ncbi:MAG TPA: glycosyltransferase family 1 protein [Bryobacteraceae bacterium]|nr:glycosyltransferase family 1 protein [Bryobacteraceae bacterium]